MADQDYNPIKSVTPCDENGTPTGATVLTIMIPAQFKPTVVDVSAPDAGRTEDVVMHKMRVGQTIRFDIQWDYPTRVQCAALYNVFQSEYVLVEHIDPRVATGYVTHRFYVGDRTSPLWNSFHGRWEYLAFGIIQQDADDV